MLANEVPIFDTQKNTFYKLNKKTKEKSDLTSFSQISAIQILNYVNTHRRFGTPTTYTNAYELNLVLEDKRVNIEANSDYKEIQKNARRISRLINVPIVEVKKS